MKKFIYILLTSLSLIFLISCEETETKYIHFETNGGSLVSSIEFINEIELDEEPVTEKEGFNFLGWYKESDFSGNKITFPFKTNKTTTLYANFLEEKEEVYYKVSFDTNGGNEIDDILVLENEKVEKPIDPKKEGYIFINWLLDGEEFDFNTNITNDITLIANYKEDNFVLSEVLSFDFGTESATGYDSSTFTFTNTNGESYTLNKARAQINSGNESYQKTQEQGVVLAPVKDKVESYVEFDFSEVDNLAKIEFEITAWNKNAFNRISKFTDASLNVYKVINNDEEVLMESIDGNALDKLEDGKYTNVSFNLDGNGIYKIKYVAPSAITGNTNQALLIDNLVVYSLVEAGDYHRVTFDYNYAGSPSSRVELVSDNSLVEEFEPERLGYDFLGWYLNDDPFNFDTKITENITLKAKWELSKVVVTFDFGYLDKEDEILLVDLDDNINNIDIPDRLGYTFKGWYLSVKDSDNHTEINFPYQAKGSIRLIAKWEKDNLDYDDLERDDSKLDEIYKSLSNKTGEDLFNELREIVTNMHNPVDYGEARYALEVADRHPHDESKVLTIYDRDKIEGPWNHPNWEREHVWPNSKLGVIRADNNHINQASDLHNLRAIVPVVNQRRGNRYFVNTNLNSPIGHQVGDGTYYPGNEDIGDVSRIFLYMVVRYDDLKLTNDHNLLRLGDINSNNNTVETAYMGRLDVLYDWHMIDPVDDFEIRRNDVIEDYQGNRNPFIDHPELFKEVYDYLVELDNERISNINKVEIVINNEYIINVDISFIKRDENEYVI